MALTEPGKIITPWANAGLKNAIPDAANPVSGSAGYDLGFPPVTMTPPEAGGIPPQGQDFNGILYSVTQILQFIQAGGIPTFSATLAASAGGYAKGAIVMSTNGITLWQNTVAGNTTDPDAGGTNWVDAMLRFLPKRSFGVNDYIRIPDVPGGLVIQWCVTAPITNGGSVSGTWPVTFPNSALSAVGTPIGSGVNISSSSVGLSISPGGYVAFDWGSIAFSAGVRLIAIGY